MKQAADTWGVKPILLRHLPNELVEHLAFTFSAMLRDGMVPKEWKRADVIPLFKGGGKDAKMVKSYRPVVITNLLCRVL